MNTFSLSGQIVDVVQRRIYPGTITVADGYIAAIKPDDAIKETNYILPGFIDAHIHIESSMLVPSEFARLATIHGTVATVSDPHEIANVLGIDGVRYMIENGKQVPFHFYFGAPSCVPATNFETSGATIDASGIEALFRDYQVHYLSEMMNFPGVLQQDPLVMDKIAIAKRYKKPIDGHAPGLRGKEAAKYIEAGISTDHECFTLEEALDKIRYGMKILIREGSAAKNYEALHPLIGTHPEHVMFCSDDKHPHELVDGHINLLVRRSIEKGYDVMDVLRAACYHPVQHYHLKTGLLQPGNSADFIVVDNLHDFNVQSTFIKGLLVAQDGQTKIERVPVSIVNQFNCHAKSPKDFAIKAEPGQLQVIQVIEGQLVTNKVLMDGLVQDGCFISDPSQDVLKIAVVNRYQDRPPAIGFINQFGLKKGAIASCIAHDSHNIICVGVTDEDICTAVNAVIQHKGGIAVAADGLAEALPLPIGGIMSGNDGCAVAKEYVVIDQLAKNLGTPLQAPFMTLSFMALLVIPSLKLSDKGLFDGSSFTFAPLVIA
ncbi:Adenine deaminase [Candidatus Protochlamydia naegleriophila]|uniref:Adenine deaminase n=1 Tax=Candidatus Protochlamydia naegleriophila TaxID=389348 RepID=A0A0U5JD08_9BACT|nr:adenine deaminase [Candidatus Protochlamydia naegleriophila]CUI16271.1 Adenine deaminase [Candidatus Protochlamydia naegleriophila]